MNRNLNLVIVGLGVLLLIVGVIYFTQFRKSTGESAQNQTQASPANTQIDIKGSFKSLLSGGKNMTCTYSNNDTQGGGTVYVADKKFRSDSTVDIKGKTSEAHVLSDGDYIYIWSDKEGSKMKLTEAEKIASQTAVQNQSLQALDKEMNMKCDSWNVETSKFVVPTDVKFNDLTEMMMKIQSNGAKPAIDKSMCDAITDANAKASCMKALEK